MQRYSHRTMWSSSLVRRRVVLVLKFDQVAGHLVTHAHDALVDQLLELAVALGVVADGVVDGREVVEDEELFEVGDKFEERLARACLSKNNSCSVIPCMCVYMYNRLQEQCSSVLHEVTHVHECSACWTREVWAHSRCWRRARPSGTDPALPARSGSLRSRRPSKTKIH